MSRNLLALSVGAILLGGTALAEVPNVAVDIAPVHSLVARVMEGMGSPDLIVAPGGTPHEYSLRPSEASALQNADLVFWMGPDLTPWLEGAIASLAPDAEISSLLSLQDTEVLPFRSGVFFEAHDHDHNHDHDEAEHEDHAHDEGHDEGAHSGEEHEHDGGDPHAWLSIDNAMVWTTYIAETLAAADPENAAAYQANAEATRSDLADLSEEIAAILDPVRDRNFIVFHDAYQYFETAFDFPSSGAISLSDATDPSPARIAEIQDRVADQDVRCVLSEPQFDPGIVAAVMEGSEAQTGVLDPLGSDLEPGPQLYPRMMRNLAGVLAECLD